MLRNGIMAVCSDIHTGHANALRRQNLEHLILILVRYTVNKRFPMFHLMATMQSFIEFYNLYRPEVISRPM